MKRFSLFRSIFILSTLALILGALPAAAQLAVTDAYDFPIRPGSEEWRAFQTHDEMLRATEIPPPVLDKMSTPGLIATVLDYPLLSDLIFFNSPQRGFDRVRARFQGLDELLARPDAGALLLERYRQMDPAAIPKGASLLEEGNLTLDFLYVEMLLAQDEILAELTPSAQRELLFESLVKKELKLERFDVYGIDGLEKTALLTGRTLAQVDRGFVPRKGGVLAEFLATGSILEVDLETIFSRAEIFLFGDVATKSSAPLSGLPFKDYTSTVTTPKGSSVTVWVTTFELTAAQIASFNQEIEDDYPNAVRETNSSRRYNCHSYAWYSQSTSNIRWMDHPGDDTYWLDGSYIPFYTIPNTRVSYVYGDHSAIAISYSEYRSKWGQGPRMRHAPTYSPYNSSTLYSYLANF